MKQFRNMVYPYVAWIAVMIVAPMLMIVLYAFTTAGNDVTTIRLPSITSPGFSVTRSFWMCCGVRCSLR